MVEVCLHKYKKEPRGSKHVHLDKAKNWIKTLIWKECNSLVDVTFWVLYASFDSPYTHTHTHTHTHGMLEQCCYFWSYRSMLQLLCVTSFKFNVHRSVPRELMSVIVQQDANMYSLLYFCILLYMFRVVTPPIIRSTRNCHYSIWHWSNFGKCSVWSQLKMGGMDRTVSATICDRMIPEGSRDRSIPLIFSWLHTLHPEDMHCKILRNFDYLPIDTVWYPRKYNSHLPSSIIHIKQVSYRQPAQYLWFCSAACRPDKVKNTDLQNIFTPDSLILSARQVHH
jgi:hypothetical protein